MADNWNTTFATAKFTLSNGNLTATATDQNHTDTIISVVSNTTGKWYFEMKVGGPSGHDLEWGLSTSSQANNTAGWLTGVQFRNATKVWRINGTETASGMVTAPTTNDIIGFAVDLTNSLIWIRNVTTSSTTWFGNNSNAGDPVAGTHGFDISIRAGLALFLSFTSNQNGANEPVTMNSGGSAFAASAPTGYTAWEVQAIDAALYSSARRNRTYLIR